MDWKLSREQEAAVKTVLDKWNSAASTWDADALSEVYAEEGLLMAGQPGHYRGKAEIRKYFLSYAVKTTRLDLVEQSAIQLSDDAFLVQGIGNFAGSLPDGRIVKNSLRTTWVLGKRQGGWKILDHHFSPIPPVHRFE